MKKCDKPLKQSHPNSWQLGSPPQLPIKIRGALLYCPGEWVSGLHVPPGLEEARLRATSYAKMQQVCTVWRICPIQEYLIHGNDEITCCPSPPVEACWRDQIGDSHRDTWFGLTRVLCMQLIHFNMDSFIVGTGVVECSLYEKTRGSICIGILLAF